MMKGGRDILHAGIETLAEELGVTVSVKDGSATRDGCVLVVKDGKGAKAATYEITTDYYPCNVPVTDLRIEIEAARVPVSLAASTEVPENGDDSGGCSET